MWYAILLGALVGYMLGNLNGAVCISTLTAHEDVRTHGSGNAGLTNFIRNYGTASAALVILIDGAKTALSCLVCGLLLEPYGFALEGKMLGAIAVTLGHNFPAALGFRGGKGILCGAVAVLVMDIRLFAVLLIIFALCVILTRYVSLGSILVAAGFSVGFAVLYWDHPWVVAGAVLIGALAIFMHRSNLVRLVKGTESKFGQKGNER